MTGAGASVTEAMLATTCSRRVYAQPVKQPAANRNKSDAGCWRLRSGLSVGRGVEERLKLNRVESVVGTYAAAKVEAERLNGGNRLGDVSRVQATREEHWNTNRITDAAAECPIVCAARAP